MRLMSVAAACAALFAVATPATVSAQTAPQPIPVVAATAPAADPAPSARKLELAHQLIEESGFRENYSTVMRAMFTTLTSSWPEKDRQLMTDAMVDTMDRIQPKMLEVSAQVYAQTYTEEELAGIVEFYKTPAGKALLKKTPQLMQNIGGRMQALRPEMMRQFVESYCARAECPPEAKKAMLSAFDKPAQ